MLCLVPAMAPDGQETRQDRQPVLQQDQRATRRSGSATFEGSVDVSWVLVPVVVRSRGGYVGELTERDFKLFVDGERVEIESFDSSHDAPTSLVWLQDLSGSMANAGKIEASRQAFRYFIDRARPADEVAIATFASALVEVEVPFTGDREALLEASDRWRGWGTTTLHDAVAFLPEISESGHHRKRAVVLITDGVDNASVLSPEESRSIVREARLPVYVLGFTTLDPHELDEQEKARLRNQRKGGKAGDEAPSLLFAELLQRLARATGGRFLRVDDPREIEQGAAAILDELRHQYVLGFPAHRGPRLYRRIRVEVAGRRRAEILHRVGYSGGPPAP